MEIVNQKRLYETMFIVSMQNGEDTITETVNKFKTIISENAEIAEVSEWGRRRLAYPINDLTEGFYMVITFRAEPGFPAELERLFGINENILRSMIIKHEHRKPAKINEAPQSEETSGEPADLSAGSPAAESVANPAEGSVANPAGETAAEPVGEAADAVAAEVAPSVEAAAAESAETKTPETAAPETETAKSE